MVVKCCDGKSFLHEATVASHGRNAGRGWESRQRVKGYSCGSDSCTEQILLVCTWLVGVAPHSYCSLDFLVVMGPLDSFVHRIDTLKDERVRASLFSI